MITDPFNSVYQGQEGTGAAFLLNGNKAAEIFHANVAQDDQYRRIAELQKQKDLEKRNTLVDKGIAGIKLEDHWMAQDEELRNKYKSLIDYGNNLKANGQNPLVNKDFKDMQERLNSEARYSGQLLSGLSAVQKEIQTHPGKYSDESIAQVQAFYDPKKPISQYQSEGLMPPALKPKYTMSGMLKGLNGSSREYDQNGRIVKEADRSKNVKIIQGLQDTPAFQNFVTEAGGNPNIGAFPVTQNGKTIYSTKDEVLLPIVGQMLEGINPSEYKSRGLHATTPEEATTELLGIVKKQNDVYGTIIQSAADQLDAGVDGSNRKDWNVNSDARGWANILLRKQSMAHSISRQNQTDAEKEDAFRKRNLFISDLRSQKPEALSRVNGLISLEGGSAVYLASKDGTKKLLRLKLRADAGKGAPIPGISASTQAFIDAFGAGGTKANPTIDINLMDPSKLDALNKLLDKIGSTSAEKKVDPNVAGAIDLGVDQDEVIDFGNN